MVFSFFAPKPILKLSFKAFFFPSNGFNAIEGRIDLGSLFSSALNSSSELRLFKMSLPKFYCGYASNENRFSEFA